MVHPNAISIDQYGKNSSADFCLKNAKYDNGVLMFTRREIEDSIVFIPVKSANVHEILMNVALENDTFLRLYPNAGYGGNPSKPSKTKKPKSTYKCTEKRIVYKNKERRIWVKDEKSYIKRIQTKNGKRQAVYTRV
jgi:hypothetical protein